MLYLVELERELELQPRFFGPRLREVLEQKLIAEASNTSSSSTPFDKCCTDHPHSSCCVIFCDVPYHGSSAFICNLQVEGTCSGKYGFIVSVTGMGDVGKGSIREGFGSAIFKVGYSCMVLRPFKGEVIDCVVTSVNKVCHSFLTQCTNLPLVPDLVLPDVRQPCCSCLH